MQHGDLAPLIKLDTEVAEEIIPSQKAHQHRPKRGGELNCCPSDGSDERSFSLMVVAKPGPGVDPAFLAVREVNP